MTTAFVQRKIFKNGKSKVWCNISTIILRDRITKTIL